MTDPVRRAYATLGLGPQATRDEVRHQYKALVRKWHPDRHAKDPRSEADAAERMREINQAYRMLAEETQPAAGATYRTYSSSGRLSREAIDDMVEALGTDGPVDWLINAVARFWTRMRVALGVLLLVGFLIRPRGWLYLLIVAMAAAGLYWLDRRREREPRPR